MTRDEEIKEAAVSFCKAEEAPNGFAFIPQSSFIVGALWADSHPHWISVEDELPKETNMYIVVHHNVVCTMLWYDSLEEWADIYVDEDEFVQSRKMDGVTHWMPLPLPPAKLSSLERTGKNWKE